jgi:hypothetical protein
MAATAATPTEYLESLEPAQRSTLAKVRAAIKKRLPKGYAETMQYGMITYVVPLKLYPAGYLGKKDVPLPVVSLAAQKRHLALYLSNVYGNPELERWFKAEWKRSGKKLDMGKSCLRFTSLDDLALDVVTESIARSPVKDFIARYEATRGKK